MTTKHILILSILFIGCGLNYKTTIPKGMVRYAKEKYQIRFVSVEGVKVLITKNKNQPFGALPLLKISVENHFNSIGYTIDKQDDITAKTGEKGAYYLTHITLGSKDQSYLVVFFLKGDSIYTIEALGKSNDFRQYEDAILNTAKNLEID